MSKIKTKTKILSAARDLFVEHGFAGTSIGNIAKLADINHSLIFHHFGNKQNLWIAVKQEIVSDSQSEEVVIPDTSLPLDKFLNKVFNGFVEFYDKNSDIVRMIYWQRLEQSDDDSGLANLRTNHIDQYIESFKEYQNSGKIKADVTPEFITSMLISLVGGISIDQVVNLMTKHAKSNYIEFCVESMVAAIAK